MLAIIPRRETRYFFERFAEVGEVVEAGGGGNFRDRLIGFAQQALGFLDAGNGQVGGEGEAGNFLKDAA